MRACAAPQALYAEKGGDTHVQTDLAFLLHFSASSLLHTPMNGWSWLTEVSKQL
jgi:hypothetical protein